jgi:hypothetical protein
VLGPFFRGPFGDTYRAVDRDKKETRPVFLRLLRPDLVTPALMPKLAEEIDRVRVLDHKNIVKTFGAFRTKGTVCLVTEALSGLSLRATAAARVKQPGDPPFSLKGAANVVAHLANAVAHARGRGIDHGGITAGNVFVNRAGRIRILDYGLPRIFPQALRDADAADRSAIAPEMLSNPARADGRADLYALGAILCELVTGRMPLPGIRPSRINPDLPEDLDALLACTFTPSPDDRFQDVASLKQAMSRVVDKALAAERQRLDDLVSLERKSHADLPGKIIVDESEYRWLVSRGNLDFGPFNLAQIKEQIARDEIVPGNILIDQEAGTRAEVEAHPLLRDLVLATAHLRDDRARVHVEQTVVKQEKRKGLALYGFLAIAVAALGIGAWFVLSVLKVGQQASASQHTGLIAASDVAGIKVGGAKAVDDREAQRRHRASRGHAAAPRSGDKFDEALSFDMADESVGDERLDESQINGVLARHGASLGRCLREESGRGGARQAEIDFVVLGSGKVSAVRVNGDSASGLTQCVRGALAAMQFPSFNGPRTRASFSMSL